MRESASSYSSLLSFLSQFTFIFNILNRVVLNLDDEERFPPLSFIVCKNIIGTIKK